MYVDNVEELEGICQQILQLDPKMRSARFINSRGHLAAGGMKDGLLSLEAKKQDEMMFMELALRVKMRHEFDAEFALIKGGGGALLQEKIVAMASDRMIVIADADKEVAQLGAFPLPVEVIPFGMNSTRISIERMLEALGYLKAKISTRMEGDRLFVTDEGNHILDLHMSVINDAKALALALNQLPGVVENGLFIDICSSVIIGHSDGRVETRDLVNGVTENSDMSAQGHNLFSDIED